MWKPMGTVESEKPAKSRIEQAKRYIRIRKASQIIMPIVSTAIFIWLLIFFGVPLNLGAQSFVIILFYVFFVIFPVLVILAIFLGRFWCGWVCLVGSIFDLVGIEKLRKVWCKSICPVGAFWSLFNKISLLKLFRDEEKCVPTMCPSKAACVKECPMEADALDQGLEDLRCIRCGNCVLVCEPEALRIGWRWSK
jgi:polyferredoxin